MPKHHDFASFWSLIESFHLLATIEKQILGVKDSPSNKTCRETLCCCVWEPDPVTFSELKDTKFWLKFVFGMTYFQNFHTKMFFSTKVPFLQQRWKNCLQNLPRLQKSQVLYQSECEFVSLPASLPFISASLQLHLEAKKQNENKTRNFWVNFFSVKITRLNMWWRKPMFLQNWWSLWAEFLCLSSANPR